MSTIVSNRSSSSLVAATLRNYAGLAAFVCALLAVVGIFVLSGVSLDALGYHYDSEGGSALQKVHPATLLMAIGLAFKMLSRPTVPGFSRLFLEEPGLLVAAVSVAVALAYVATMLKIPVTPPIDSYLMPVLASFLLKDMSRHGMRVIAVALLVVFVVNDLTAFYEYATGSRAFFVIPPEVTGHPEAIGSEIFDWKGHLAWDWRSTAMLGHPLDNALVTGTMVLVLQSRAAAWIPAWLRATLVLVNLVAMVTFGGRVALGLVVVMSAGLWAIRFLHLLLAARRLRTRALAWGCVLVPFAIAAAAFAFERGFFDKFLERFVIDDGSAETRVLMWRLFDPIPLFDLVVGPDKDVVGMWQRLQGLELGIESFWAGMPLGYGLFVSAVVMTGWLGLFAYLAKATRGAAWLPIAYFMLVASTSAGLASKTLSLGNMTVIALLFLPPARRRRAVLRQGGGAPEDVYEPADLRAAARGRAEAAARSRALSRGAAPG